MTPVVTGVARRLRAASVICVLGCTLGLAGCADTTQADSQEPIRLMPSADPFVSAVVFTNGLGTARLAVTSTVDVGGESTVRTGAITAAMDPRGYGIATWTQGDARTEELVAEKAVYVRSPAAGVRWTAHPEGVRTPESLLISPLAGLGELLEVRLVGTEQVDGAPARHYEGRLPATSDRLRALGLSPDDVARIDTTATDDPIVVSAWVDERNRIVRVDRSYTTLTADGTPITASISTNLSEFTLELDLQPPPTASVTTLPAS